MEWVLWKGLVLRGVGLGALLLLTYLFWRGAAWRRHEPDDRFPVAFALFVGGVTWALMVTTVAAWDEARDILPCANLRPWVLRHVEVVWGPLVVASGRLLWVIAR